MSVVHIGALVSMPCDKWNKSISGDVQGDIRKNTFWKKITCHVVPQETLFTYIGYISESEPSNPACPWFPFYEELLSWNYINDTLIPVLLLPKPSFTDKQAVMSKLVYTKYLSEYPPTFLPEWKQRPVITSSRYTGLDIESAQFQSQ